MGNGYCLIVYSKVTLPLWEETLALCLLCQSKWPLETEHRLSPGVLQATVFFTYCLLKQPANCFFKFCLCDWVGRYLCSKDLHEEGQCLPHVQSLPARSSGGEICLASRPWRGGILSTSGWPVADEKHCYSAQGSIHAHLWGLYLQQLLLLSAFFS